MMCDCLQLRSTNSEAITEQRLAAATEAVQVANADVAALEASLRTATDALNDTNLQAPFAGTIVATYVENFEDVEAKQPILRVLDTSKIEMVVQMPESYISYVPYARNIRVVFDAFPGKEIPAKIKEIGTEASIATQGEVCAPSVNWLTSTSPVSGRPSTSKRRA